MSLSALPAPPVALSPLWAELLKPRPDVFGDAPSGENDCPDSEAEDGASADEAA